MVCRLSNLELMHSHESDVNKISKCKRVASGVKESILNGNQVVKARRLIIMSLVPLHLAMIWFDAVNVFTFFDWALDDDWWKPSELVSH